MKPTISKPFKSNDRTFDKVYNAFDKRDYFNSQGLAKTQIGNFERALQKNDKGAQQILDMFKGDEKKAKDYITQVISDRNKERAFNNYKALKDAVGSIQKGKPNVGAVNYVKRIIHNSSQKYSIALYSALRNKKFTKWKDVHNDIDSLIGESVNEMQVVNKKTGKDITRHVLDLLSGKIDKKKFEKLTGLKKESVNEAMNVRDLPSIFDDPDDFEDWYNGGMKLRKKGIKLAPFSKSDERKLFGFVDDWIDSRDDNRYGYGSSSDMRDQIKSIEKFLKQKGKVIKESVNEASIKGRNNKTGESFGMVIGSDKQGNNGYELKVRKMYNSRISSYGFIFDKDSNLIDIRDYGYSLDGKFPDMKGHASSTSVRPNKRETITQIAKITSPAFAKKIYQHVQKNNKMDESVNEAYVVLYSPKKGVKPVTTAAYKDKKDAEKWAKDLGGITMIVKKKVKGIDESASKLAMGIAGFTGTRGDAVDDFINTHNIDAKKLFNFVKKGNLKDRMSFVAAIAGRPNNKMFKMITKQFGENLGEASLSQIHKAAKKGSYPVTVIASMLGKIVKQDLVSTPQAVPAAFKMMQGGYPKAKISVEDKTGKVLFMEACWKGYKEVGGKMKNGKQVPNCVPESKQDIVKIKKKSKSETAFYDILSTLEKKYGSRGFEKWLDSSLKDMGLNPRRFNTSAEKQEALYQSTLKEDLRNWFKSKWVNIGKKDKSGKHPPCGTSGKKKGYAKCVPAKKAASMSKKEKESATRRKRAAQNKSNRGGSSSAGQGKKPINVSTHTKGRKSGTGKGS